MRTTNPARRRRLTLGFTLVEVVIALAVLAFAFFGMISVVAYSTRMNQATKERMFAMRAAEAKIEQMLACVNFDDIFLKFGPQTALGNNPELGRGWDEIRESRIDHAAGKDGSGNPIYKDFYALQAVTPALVFSKLPTGYQPPSPPDPGIKLIAPAPAPGTMNPPVVGGPVAQITVFVRFPLDSAGYLTEVGSGEFADFRKMDPATNLPMKDPITGKPLYVDLDMNGKGGNVESANPLAPGGPTLVLSEVKILPVIIEVIWKGTVGPQSGNKGNTYLNYRYTFFRRT